MSIEQRSEVSNGNGADGILVFGGATQPATLAVGDVKGGDMVNTEGD